MMSFKNYFLGLLLLVLLPYQMSANIQRKIVGMNNKIDKTKKVYTLTFKEYKLLEKKIVQERREYKNIDKRYQRLKRDLVKNEKRYTQKAKSYKALQQQDKALVEKVGRIQNDFINHISKNLSLLLVSDDIGINDADDLMSAFVFDRYTDVVDEELQNIASNLDDSQKKLTKHKKNLKEIEQYIAKINAKAKEVNRLKIKQKKLISSLETKMKAYGRKIKRIEQDKAYLSALLTRLKIKEKKIIAQKKEQERKKREAREAQERRLAKLKITSESQSLRAKNQHQAV